MPQLARWDIHVCRSQNFYFLACKLFQNFEAGTNVMLGNFVGLV